MNVDIAYDESATRHKKRIEILKSAYRLFVENGIKDVSMQMIADDAGIEHRTLYTYYNDKELIATDIMKCCFSNIYCIDWDDREVKDTYEKVSFFLNRVFDYIISDHELLLFMAYFNSYYSQSNTDYLEYIDSYYKLINAIDWEEANSNDHSVNSCFANNMAHNYFLLVSSIYSYAISETIRQAKANTNPPDYSAVREFKDLQLLLIKA